MRSIAIALLVFACGSDEPTAQSSHPPMPNQIEVGSTLAGRYRIVKKLGEVGDYQVLAAQHARLDKSFTVMAPRPGAHDGASARLDDAAKRHVQRALAGEIAVADVGTTPDGMVFVVLDATDQQVKDLLAGAVALGG